MGRKKLREKLAKTSGVLLGVAHVMNLARLIVERPVQTKPLIIACGRDHRTRAFERPDFRQGRVQVNFTFVKVDKVEAGILFDCAFFKNARIAFFSL